MVRGQESHLQSDWRPLCFEPLRRPRALAPPTAKGAVEVGQWDLGGQGRVGAWVRVCRPSWYNLARAFIMEARCAVLMRVMERCKFFFQFRNLWPQA